MASSAHRAAASVFEALIENGDIDLVDQGDECQVSADDWPLIPTGAPVTSAMVALEDESGEPEAALRAAIDDEQLEAIRLLDGEMDGELSAMLSRSPDELARTLADMLLN